jgi:predicted aldo/keto reductase-like oxidoreductase
VGLGGEGVLRTHDREKQATEVIAEAASLGINYFDSARAYAGSQGYYGSFYRSHQEIRSEIFQTSKSAARGYHEARSDLNETLQVMGTESLDLWQIHDLRTREEKEEIQSPGGALQAFIEAKDAGLTKYIGVTGHHDPEVLLAAIESWPLDAVLLPVNPAEALIGGFMDRIMTAALDRGMAVIGMKVLGAGNYIEPRLGITPDLLIRFALSRDITTAIVGCSSPEEVQLLARLGEDDRPLDRAEEERLMEQFRPHAERLAYYRG